MVSHSVGRFQLYSPILNYSEINLAKIKHSSLVCLVAIDKDMFLNWLEEYDHFEKMYTTGYIRLGQLILY
jgi:hypothetical protein